MGGNMDDLGKIPAPHGKIRSGELTDKIKKMFAFFEKRVNQTVLMKTVLFEVVFGLNALASVQDMDTQTRIFHGKFGKTLRHKYFWHQEVLQQFQEHNFFVEEW